MPAITPGTTLHSFVDAFRKAISDVFSQALGSAWSVQIDENDAASPPEVSSLCFQLQVSGGLQGNVAVQLQNPHAILIAQKFLAEAVDPAVALSQDHKDALEELLRQVTGPVVTGLKSTFGEIKFDVRSVEPPAWEGIVCGLLAAEGSSPAFPVKFRLSSELLASISSAPSTSPKAQPKAEVKSVAGATSEPNFDLLLGVNLGLTLRFGQCVMLLREVLDLNSGSVIELDREVTEPADLLLGDKLIARGEVVIVDGNYGIRITEVADPRQRLTTV